MSREIDWDGIAALYADHSIPVTEIARRFGVSPHKISARARRHGWTMRRPRMRAPQPKRRIRALLRRMFRALDLHMHEIEQRLHSEPGETLRQTAADRERDARTLASLARTLEQLRDIEHKAKEAARADRAEKSARTAVSADDKERPDTEGLRDELERRLDRLMATAGKGVISGEPE